MPAKLMDVIQLDPATAEHCGFKFAQVTQVNGDGSVFVTGKIGDGGQWFVSADGYQMPAGRK
jgi:hypothetical protein